MEITEEELQDMENRMDDLAEENEKLREELRKVKAAYKALTNSMYGEM